MSPAPSAITGTPAQTPAPRLIGLRIALVILAGVEAYLGVLDWPVLARDPSNIPGGLGGLLIRAHLAMHPVLATAAVVLAPVGPRSRGIIALGIMIVMAWLNEMPSIVARGFDIRSVFSFVETTARIIVFPLIAACAIAYAAHNEHPGRATFLVAVPTLFNIVLLAGFFISVMIYGF